MTAEDSFAFSDRANDLRMAKALVLARWLYAHGLTPEDGNLMDVEERKDAERRAGRARGPEAKPLTTQHRDLLWNLALGALAEKLRWHAEHPPEPYESDEVLPMLPCDLGCHRPVRRYAAGVRCDEHAPQVA